jgi:membrane protein
MNPFERGIRTVDAWQQRHRVPAFAFAVFKKFGDDQAGNLVALLTYFAFLATFPLLLALSGILGLVLKGDPSLQASIQTSALSEFPIIGTQLQSEVGVASLGHSTPALIIGIVGAILGGQGLAARVRQLRAWWPGGPAILARLKETLTRFRKRSRRRVLSDVLNVLSVSSYFTARRGKGCLRRRCGSMSC